MLFRSAVLLALRARRFGRLARLYVVRILGAAATCAATLRFGLFRISHFIPPLFFTQG